MSQPQWPPSMPDPSERTTGYVPGPPAGSPYEPYQPYQPYPPQPSPYQYQYPPAVDYGAGYATAPGPVGTNGLAITALILGLLGLCGIAAVIGLILGIIALAQIRRTGQSGAGLAWAGVVLSALWLVAAVAFVAYGVTQGISAANRARTLPTYQPPVARTTPSGRPTVPTTGQPVFIFRLNVGDCIADYDESAPSLRVTVVACTVAHRGETVGKFDLTGAAYPGDQAVAQLSQSGCADRFKAYAPRSFNDSSLKLIVNRPTELSWKDNDKSVVCMVFDKVKTRTGSLRG